MTRLAPTLPPGLKPTSVALSELAIAAGLAGDSIAVRFQDYPAPVLCGLWQYLACAVESSAVVHARGQADVRRLPENLEEVRLVFVHSPKHYIGTQWAVQMEQPGHQGEHPRPAVFAQANASDLDEDPGATLVLRCNTREREQVTSWLLNESCRLPDWTSGFTISPAEANATLVAVDSALDRLRHHLREQRVLRGLLAGTALLQTLGHANQANDVPHGIDDAMASIRALLLSPVVIPVDEPWDSLAIEMVNRANVYLAVRFGGDSSERNPFYVPDRGYRFSDSQPPRPMITRREIADLGNSRSGMVRRLIEYLKRIDNGYEMYERMGHTRRVAPRAGWHRGSADSLASSLLTWSAKQVRSHFDRLQRSGYIVAERPRPNGPWLYKLPEELTAYNNPYQRLLTRGSFAGNNTVVD